MSQRSHFERHLVQSRLSVESPTLECAGALGRLCGDAADGRVWSRARINYIRPHTCVSGNSAVHFLCVVCALSAASTASCQYFGLRKLSPLDSLPCRKALSTRRPNDVRSVVALCDAFPRTIVDCVLRRILLTLPHAGRGALRFRTFFSCVLSPPPWQPPVRVPGF